jgi:hypothetical protein
MSKQNDTESDGIRVDLISSSQMERLGQAEKIGMIIDGVRENKIVILEAGLTPKEEGLLIERVMRDIDPVADGGFRGIEIESYPQGGSSGGFLGKVLGRENNNRLTVIGPANRIKTLHKDESLISAVISRP